MAASSFSVIDERSGELLRPASRDLCTSISDIVVGRAGRRSVFEGVSAYRLHPPPAAITLFFVVFFSGFCTEQPAPAAALDIQSIEAFICTRTSSDRRPPLHQSRAVVSRALLQQYHSCDAPRRFTNGYKSQG